MIRNELKKGIHFSSEKSDKFKTSMLVINFSIPLSDENSATYSLLSDVMKRGCSSFPTYKEISKRLIDLYSSFGCYVYKKGESLCFGIYNSFLDEKFIPDKVDVLKENIDFISDFIFSPLIIDGAFNNDYIEQERVNLINRIAEKINDKGSYSINRCIEIMCQNEKYSVTGTGSIEAVKNVSNNDLIQAYDYLIKDSIVDIYYFGSFDNDHVEKKLSTIIDSFPERKNCFYPETLVKVNTSEAKYITEEVDATQGKLVLGFRANMSLIEDDFPSLVLYNEILGASPISKLFMNVREKLSLCYYCYSYLDALKGLMIIGSGIDNNDYQKTVDAILQELDKMSSGEITDEEVDSAKISLINSYKEIYDSPFSLINWYHTRHIVGMTETPELFSEAIQNTTKNDVIKISKKIKLDIVYFLKGIGND